MLGSIIDKFKRYCEANKKSHDRIESLSKYNPKTDKPITLLSEDILNKIGGDISGELYALEIVNDDITPMVYVVHVLNSCLNIDYDSSVNIMIKIHSEGAAKVVVGSFDVITIISEHITKDAKERQFPLGCLVVNA